MFRITVDFYDTVGSHTKSRNFKADKAEHLNSAVFHEDLKTMAFDCETAIMYSTLMYGSSTYEKGPITDYDGHSFGGYWMVNEKGIVL